MTEEEARRFVEASEIIGRSVKTALRTAAWVVFWVSLIIAIGSGLICGALYIGAKLGHPFLAGGYGLLYIGLLIGLIRALEDGHRAWKNRRYR